MTLQQTLSILKPDATRRNLNGKINTKIEESGLKIIAQKRLRLTKEQAQKFYAVHEERSFFNELCDYMISGPIVSQVLEGEDAVARYSEIMGDTHPEYAALGTIPK